MTRIINRYLFLEMVPPFLVSMAFFTFIFLMKQIMEITNLIVNHKVGLVPVVLLMIYAMPYFLQYVIPMSVMMAVLLAFLRLSGDNEIVALKAGGVSVYRFLLPVIVFSMSGTVLTGYMSIYGLPKGTSAFKSMIVNIASSNLDVGLKEQTFNDSFNGVMLYVNKIDLKNRELRDVFIEDRRTGNVRSTVNSPKGVLFSDPDNHVWFLRLFKGVINQVNLETQSSNTLRFETYDIRLDLKKAGSRGNTHPKSTKEMSIDELRQYIDKREKKDAEYYSALIRLHKKFSVPFACVSMGILAIPLGLKAKSSKRSFGIGLGLMFFLLYYIMLSVGTVFGEAGVYPPIIGMWAPNVVMGGFGIFLLVRAAREQQFDLGWVVAGLWKLKNRFFNR